jgi:hypothetical protein
MSHWRRLALGALVPLRLAFTPPSQEIARNPRYLHAMELLARQPAGAQPLIRFEWEQVTGAHEYVLTGRWTEVPSWTMHAGEFRVTPRNAATWNARHVLFEVPLPEGSHSWRVVAVIGPHDEADFENPTLLSFDVR